MFVYDVLLDVIVVDCVGCDVASMIGTKKKIRVIITYVDFFYIYIL